MRCHSRQRRHPALHADLDGPVHDRHDNPLADAVLIARATGDGGENELIDAGRLALRAPDVQLLDQVKADVDRAYPGGRLGLLDHEPLMGCIDGAPPERAHLRHPRAASRQSAFSASGASSRPAFQAMTATCCHVNPSQRGASGLA